MSTSPNVLVVFGSGPGIGSETAKAFAKKQYFSKIVLVSRNAERLNTEAEEVRAAGDKSVEVTTYSTDISDIKALRSTLKKIEQLGPLGSVFYNGARINITPILEAPAEELEEDYRTTNVGLYVVAQWAVPLLKKSGHDRASFIVTNTFLTAHPLPVLLSLSAAKAGQYNMVSNLNEAFGKDIHFGLVMVNGLVKADATNLNPTSIAGQIVGLYEQSKEEWKLTVDINE